MKVHSCLFVLILFCVGTAAFSQQTRLRNNLKYSVQQINDSLKKYSSTNQQIRILNDSVFVIENGGRTFFQVNVDRLYSKASNKDIRNFIRMEELRPQAHTENSGIVFDHQGRLNFFKLDNQVLKRIYSRALNICWLMRLISQQASPKTYNRE